MTPARLQHYVPQFLLRRFTDDGESLGVFDKLTGKMFETGTRVVAAEHFFYDATVGEHVLTLEPSLAELERKAAEVIARIHERESLGRLTSVDRGTLATFIAVAALRTRFVRENLIQMSGQLAERVNTIVPDDRPDARLSELSEEEAKRITLRLVSEGSGEIAMIIAQKPWVLVRAPCEDLYIGDNPVTMHNDRDLGFYGSIGFAVRGVEIHFPLSARLALFVPCPTTAERWRESLASFDSLSRRARRRGSHLAQQLKHVRGLVRAIDEGTPLDLRPENVVRENSLQVGYAGRWVFSKPGNFDLARQMLAAADRYRKGPFGTVY